MARECFHFGDVFNGTSRTRCSFNVYPISVSHDARGKKVIDTAELEQFYGQLKSPAGIAAGNTGNSQSVPADNSKITVGGEFPQKHCPIQTP